MDERRRWREREDETGDHRSSRAGDFPRGVRDGLPEDASGVFCQRLMLTSIIEYPVRRG